MNECGFGFFDSFCTHLFGISVKASEVHVERTWVGMCTVLGKKMRECSYEMSYVTVSLGRKTRQDSTRAHLFDSSTNEETLAFKRCKSSYPTFQL